MQLSIVVPTFNRADFLNTAIRALVNQSDTDIEYEVIIVDNNSKDRTAHVVAEWTNRDPRIRYVLEKRQGCSYARNTGIEAARSDLLAFCDDDVTVDVNWVERMVAALKRFPDAAFVGGKVLPVWSRTPPNWLTPTTPGLALQDLGEEPARVSLDHQRCLITACFAARRQAFEKFGLFPIETQRVNDGLGSLEDYAWELNVWQNGGHGMYVPNIVCWCEVPPERMQKQYHRKWFLGHGKFSARARRPEYEQVSRRLFQVPSFMYREIVERPVKMISSMLKRDDVQAFQHQTMLLFYLGFIRERQSVRIR